MDELLEKLKIRLRFSGTTEDDVLLQHLLLAIETVNLRRQFTPTDELVVEARYNNIVVEMAVCTYSKMGAEGQLMHTENGISREYEQGLYPYSLLRLITMKPHCLPVEVVE